MKVSVIIPAFNRADRIAGTIRSVLQQTFTDYEIIVVDDGSTDNTAAVVRQEFGDRVICVSKANGGPASARNLGISIARGEYIAFLDSDDLWLPEKLELQVRYMDEHPATGLSFTWALAFSETASGAQQDLELLAFRDKPSLRLILTHNFIPCLTVMVRRQCLERAGVFDERRELIGKEDYDFWIRVAMQCELVCIPTVLARYRVSSSTLSGAVPQADVFDSYLEVMNGIDRKFPNLLKETFGSRRRFFAERYHEAANLIPYRGGNAKRKAHLYLQALKRHPASISLLRKLMLASLFSLLERMR